MVGQRTVVVVATLDTKGPEAAFLRDWFAARGRPARLIDVGLLGAPLCPLGAGDVPADRVATAAGTSLWALRSGRRDAGMAAMGLGAGQILAGWAADGTLAGAVGIGGNQGTAIACTALRALPLGFPKVVVSTIASGDIRPFIGASDIAVIFSLADLLAGPNRVTRGVLSRAAGMLDGMIGAAEEPAVETGLRSTVALTALGNTHAAAVRVIEALDRGGFEVVPFHASGAGGAAMERFIGDGVFAGVVDLTTHELLGELYPEDAYAPAEGQRVVAAGRLGLPQVVAPGGLDYFIFGPPESVPPRLRERPTHRHNPYNMNVLARAEERMAVGRLLAERLNAARGPVAFLYPLRGWSYIGRAGGLMWDPEAAEAFREALRTTLRGDGVRYREVDANINDPVFADEVVREFLDLVREPRDRKDEVDQSWRSSS
jgi:uncharacterized protein (UPF0261 family)